MGSQPSETMNTDSALVTRKIPAAALERLQRSVTVELWPHPEPPPPYRLRELIGRHAGLLCLLTDCIDRAALDAAPQLRVVSTMSVGYEHIDLAACAERGIAVGHTPGVLTDATADFAVALLLAVARRLAEGAAYARSGAWTTWDPMGLLGLELAGSTVGIFGLGRIGEAVARRLQPFGPRLLYCDRVDRPQAERSLGIERVELPALLARSDVLTLHAQLTPETEGQFNAQTIRMMKPSAILINTARGKLVDTGALLEGLQRGWIAAAGLDVTDPEPLPPDHPLYQLPNCLIMPHIASATETARGRMAEMAVDNLLAGLAGNPLPFPAPGPAS